MKNIVASITQYIVTRKASYRAVRALIASVAVLVFLAAAWLIFVPTASMQSQVIGAGAVVRHAPQINGRVEGSVRQLTGESITLNSGAAITGDLLVPGTPQLQINGSANFGGTVQGAGSAQPSGHRVTLNSGATLGHLVTRTDPITMASVPAPPAPTGTRDVTLNSPGQSVGDFATLRNLTLNSNVGIISVPPGTYGSFTINSGSGVSLGVAGATQPAIYNLNALTLNSNGQIQVVGPVVLTVNLSVTLNASMGSSANPLWLKLNVASGGVTLNSGSVLHGIVRAPSGVITINGRLNGSVFSDRLTINSGGVLHGVGDTSPPAITVQQPMNNLITASQQVTVTGTVADQSGIAVIINNIPAAISGDGFTVTVPLVEGQNSLRITAVDSFGNSSEVVQTITRDTTPPVLTIVRPAEDELTNQVIVSGTVEDATAVSVTISGASVSVSQGNFANELSLPDGAGSITVTAIDAAGNRSEMIRTIRVDTTGPTISELTPGANAVIDSTSPFMTLRGRVTDASGFFLTVAGIDTAVTANGLFTVSDIPIIEGENRINIIAVDKLGNRNTIELAVMGRDMTPPPAPTIFASTSLTRLTSQSIEGRAELGAMITITGGVQPVTAKAADGTGLFIADVNLATGQQTLSVTAKDAANNLSPAIHLTITSDPGRALPPAGQAHQINVSTGNAQEGLTAIELPRPLIAIVTDRNGASLPNVAVRFTVAFGGGHFTDGSNSFEALTDAQGYARTQYVCGSAPGIQIIRADFTGNLMVPAVFVAEAVRALAGQATKFSGLVLDQNLRALQNVLVRLGSQQARTGADGRFVIANAAAGPHQLLEVIGRDQLTLPGRWPNISYDVDVLPGVDNNLGRPLFLPKVNDGIEMPLDANNIITRNTTYELPSVGGQLPIKVTAKAGTRVSFPPDVTDKRLSVTRIATNRVPMALEDGRATSLYISVQPAGAIFDPPLDVSFPNLDEIPANNQVLLMSFDHDAGRYVKVGTGRVSADGKTVSNEPGSGIRVGAWHGFPAIPPCPEAVVLGSIQLGGNPLFHGKAIVNEEVWVEGARAIRMTGPDDAGTASSWTYRATLTLPCVLPGFLVKMESTVETAEVEVTEVTEKLNLSVGDAEKKFSVNFRVSKPDAQFTMEFEISALNILSGRPNGGFGGTAQAKLKVPPQIAKTNPGSNEGSVEVSVTAKPVSTPGSSGIFAIRPKINGNLATQECRVVVPPQILLTIMKSEFTTSTQFPSPTVHEMIGWSHRNRLTETELGNPYLFKNERTYQDIVNDNNAAHGNPANGGEEPYLSAAAAAFDGFIDVSRGSQGYWSPTPIQWTKVQALLRGEEISDNCGGVTRDLPKNQLVTGIAILYCCGNVKGCHSTSVCPALSKQCEPTMTQVVYFTSVPLSPLYTEPAPAFLFVRKRPAGGVPIVQVP
jgi:hypothetical protein